jgi:glyoxylase-like metal-dependent hydrolase (beta-lactamase superfamily II)
MRRTEGAAVRVELLRVGSCAVPKAALSPISAHGHGPPLRDWFAVTHVPALVLLVHHDVHGPVLIDTGYAPRFREVTRRWPERGYAITTPMRLPEHEQLLVQLAARGVSPRDVRHVVLTHLHADHVGGLRDFSDATIHVRAPAVDPLMAFGTAPLGRLRGTRAAFLRALLPDDFTERVQLLEKRVLRADQTPETLRTLLGVSPHETAPRAAYDVFGDETVLAVDLPGHAPGMVGILLPTVARPLFLVADAVWSIATMVQGARFGFAERRIAWDARVAAESLRRLQAFVISDPQISAPFALVSSHDAAGIAAYVAPEQALAHEQARDP